MASWNEILDAARAGRPLWYQAPLDFRPVRLTVRRVFKNGKIRFNAPNVSCDPFTADSSHADRITLTFER